MYVACFGSVVVDSFELCDSSDNWEYINGFCYKLFDQKSNWFDAQSICHQYNADLYVPSSYRMVQSISDLIPCRAPDQKAWIGVSDTVRTAASRTLMSD